MIGRKGNVRTVPATFSEKSASGCGLFRGLPVLCGCRPRGLPAASPAAWNPGCWTANVGEAPRSGQREVCMGHHGEPSLLFPLGRQEVAACIRGRSWQLASFGMRVGEQGSGCISSSFLTATWVFITSHASDFSKMIALLLCFKDGSVKTHLNILTQTEEFIPSDRASMTHLSLSSLFVRQT